MKCLIVFVALLVASEALNKYCLSKGKIEVIIEPPSVINARLGDTVSIVCAAHGHRTADPYVYWLKDLGPSFKEKGKHLGPVAIGKSILFFDSLTKADITTYRCVIESCCSNEKIEIDVDIIVPDDTCKDRYGIGNVIYGATWVFSNYTDAIDYCAAQGMEIAFPRTREENAQLLADVQTSFNRHPNARKYAHENWLWIGGHDTAQEGVWKEQTTDKLITWTNWQKGQPDNWNGDHDRHKMGQDCIGLNRETGRWDDSFVFYKRPFACKCPDKKKKNGK